MPRRPGARGRGSGGVRPRVAHGERARAVPGGGRRRDRRGARQLPPGVHPSRPHRGVAGAAGPRSAVELAVSTFKVPTDAPESDGTFEWDATTLVVVEADGGLGWTYAPAAAGTLVRELLAPAIRDPDDLPACWAAMLGAVRNAGPWGLAMYAISAVDIALWDRKARRLGVALVELLGRRRETVAVYGSGGFCSYADERLREQLGGWVAQGIPRVKMKVGRGDDERRVAVAREAVGDAELMVDANGAWDVATAERMADALA